MGVFDDLVGPAEWWTSSWVARVRYTYNNEYVYIHDIILNYMSKKA